MKPSRISARKRFACAIAGVLALIALSTSAGTVSADSNEAAVGGPVVGTQGAISLSNIHKCAVKTDGSAWCWGSQWYGELGSGGPGQLLQPAQVVGLGSGIKSIAAGENTTCAVTTTGGLKCWGTSTGGKIGDGTTTGSNFSPVDVPGLSTGVKSVSVGLSSVCAVLDSGGLKCWGGSHTDIGSGLSAGGNVTTPTDVSGLTSGVAAVSVGAGTRQMSCALTTSGGVKCWGIVKKTTGDLTTNVPVDMPGLTSGVASISVGEGTLCVVTTAGGAKCVGDNSDGQFGDGTTTSSDTPVDVTGLTSGVVSVSVARDHACALTNYGAVKCWGYNWYGTLGDGTQGDSNNYRLTPVQALGLTSNAVAISAAGSTTCAITNQNAAYCWGDSIVGDGGSDWKWEPTLVLSSGVGPTAPVLTTTTTTVAAPTTTTVPGGSSSGGAAPVPLADGSLPSLDPGSVTATVDGVDSPVTSTRQGSRLRLSSGPFSLSVGATSDGTTAPVSEDGALEMPAGSSLSVSGTGFKAGTTVRVWIVDGKKLLKKTVSTSSGTLKLSSVLPASLGAGTYTLQIVGTDENGAAWLFAEDDKAPKHIGSWRGLRSGARPMNG